MSDPTTQERWLGPGVAGIGTASFLADVGHEIPTALLPSLLTATLGAPAAALGLIEGIADGLAGAARLVGGAIADDPHRRRVIAVGGYATTAVLSGLSPPRPPSGRSPCSAPGPGPPAGCASRPATPCWPTRPRSPHGRAYGFERAMDNLGAIAGLLLALALVGLVGVRTAIALSVIPGLLAALAIVYAIRHAPRAEQRDRQPLRLRVRPVLAGRLGRLLVGVSAFELGNVAATLASVPAGRLGDRRGAVLFWSSASACSGWPTPASPPVAPACWPWRPGSRRPGWRSAVWRRPSTPPWPPSPRPSHACP
jgi:hypothetical protein